MAAFVMSVDVAPAPAVPQRAVSAFPQVRGKLADLAPLRNLAHLDLSDTKVRGALRGLGLHCTQLRVLKLVHTRARGLVGGLSSCSELQHLDLAFSTEVKGTLKSLTTLHK
jgi:hypothetical protein